MGGEWAGKQYDIVNKWNVQYLTTQDSKTTRTDVGMISSRRSLGSTSDGYPADAVSVGRISAQNRPSSGMFTGILYNRI